jgi:pre-rRNA-processing protein IPI3
MAPPPSPPKKLVLASSSADAGVAAWDLRTGAEEIRLRPCASCPRALASVGDRFLAAAQAIPRGGNSGTVHFYHWDKVCALSASRRQMTR